MSGNGAPHRIMLRRAVLTGYACLATFVGALGAWSVAAPISGAVVAPGQFVAETNQKKVQHQYGGVVAELKVREGDRVRAGDLLIRLDETVAKANLSVITRQIDEFAVRLARLEAERDQRGSIVLPAAFSARLAEPEFAALLAAETRLFDIRATARAGQKAQLEKRLVQLRAEIDGLDQQRSAKMAEAAMIARELTGVRELFSKQLVQITRLSQLEREGASLEGQRGQLTAQIAQAEGKIAEIELQIIQMQEDLRAEAMKEIRDIQARSVELSERRVAAEDQLRRIDIRAPETGYVHQLAVHTVGGVISAAEPAMMIVPSREQLYLEVRVMPQDIDQLHLGQSATVRIRAFNQRTTPELKGTLSRMAADVVREQNSGAVFYLMRVAIADSELARIQPLAIVAGMQADVYIETGARSPLAYLMKPVSDQFAKAFRER